MGLYSAFIVVPHTHTPGAQVCITQCCLQITPYLPLPRKHSPDGTSPDWGCGPLIAAYYYCSSIFYWQSQTPKRLFGNCHYRASRKLQFILIGTSLETGSAVFWVTGHFSTPPENWTVRAFLQLTPRLSNDFTAAWLTFTFPQLFAVAATLKSIDYNVGMTFILNNNNNNNNNILPSREKLSS